MGIWEFETERCPASDTPFSHARGDLTYFTYVALRSSKDYDTVPRGRRVCFIGILPNVCSPPLQTTPSTNKPHLQFPTGSAKRFQNAHPIVDTGSLSLRSGSNNEIRRWPHVCPLWLRVMPLPQADNGPSQRRTFIRVASLMSISRSPGHSIRSIVTATLISRWHFLLTAVLGYLGHGMPLRGGVLLFPRSNRSGTRETISW